MFTVDSAIFARKATGASVRIPRVVDPVTAMSAVPMTPAVTRGQASAIVAQMLKVDVVIMSVLVSSLCLMTGCAMKRKTQEALGTRWKLFVK